MRHHETYLRPQIAGQKFRGFPKLATNGVLNEELYDLITGFFYWWALCVILKQFKLFSRTKLAAEESMLSCKRLIKPYN